MPANTRQWARRKLESTSNNLDWAGKHLYEVYEVYQQPQPEIAEALLSIMESILQLDKVVNDLRNSF